MMPLSLLVNVLALLLLRSGSAFQASTFRTRKVSHLRPLTRIGAVNKRTLSQQDIDFNSAILAGNSSKVKRLRQTIQQVFDEENAVSKNIIVLGPKGCGKESVVEAMLKRLPTQDFHKLKLDDAIDLLDSMKSALDALADQTNTTLVLKGFESRTTSSESEFEKRQQLEHIVEELIVQETYKDAPFLPQIIYSTNQEPEFLKKRKDIPIIKVPAFEARAQDLADIASAKLQGLEKEYGLRNVAFSRQALRRLLDHTWLEGEPELDRELQNALLRLGLEQKRYPLFNVMNAQRQPLALELQSKHMLVTNHEESMRSRLLYNFPILRQIVQSPWIMDHTIKYIVTPVFILFLVILFGGAQTREHSAALTVFWAGWWPAVMLSFPFLGRIWCSICPFMAVGNMAQEVSTNVLGTKLKKWPKAVTEWGPPFAFSLFFAILIWEELWDLPNNATLSAWLLLLITSGAVFNSIQFEKRMWCRYLCPIGAMCGTFGTMSMVEVRSFKANCIGCTNPQCVNGDSNVPDLSDTFALKGCTMGLKNNQLRDMGSCTLCMSCVKNCDKEVPEVNTRPIGIDYGLPWLLPPVFQDPVDVAVSQVETNYWYGALLTVLQGSVLLHYMPRILYDLGLDPALAKAPVDLSEAFYVHAAATVLLLALPGVLSLVVDKSALQIENIISALRRNWGKPTAETARERRMIIETYETLLQSDRSLADIIEELDPDGDGNIACWEFERALEHLKLPQERSETLLNLIRKRVGQERIDSMPVGKFLDTFQRLYLEARGNDNSIAEKVQLETTSTFVELFNELDEDDDGFIMPGDFDVLLDRKFKIQRSWEDKLELFRSADVIGQGRLNLFEFMTLIRKVAQAGIQEIGYGYLPLAWASLTAYWLSLGMKELGFVLARAPDTFFLDQVFRFNLPYLTASDQAVATVQAILVLSALPISIGLTQKLCQDNSIGGTRFAVHAAVQIIGAWTTLYLMLSPNPLLAAQ